MILYAVRHGQTDYNKNRLVQGKMDNPLNESGRDQAKQMGLYFKTNHITFDYIYSSPLSRAVETATIIRGLLNTNHPINLSEKLVERDFGPFEGKSVDETIKTISQDGFKHEGYEDNSVFINRIKDGLQTLYQNHPNSVILLTAHSHTIKALLHLSDPSTYHFLTYLNNASLCIFQYDGKDLITQSFNIEAI